jgi:hypothetical protein
MRIVKTMPIRRILLVSVDCLCIYYLFKTGLILPVVISISNHPQSVVPAPARGLAHASASAGGRRLIDHIIIMKSEISAFRIFFIYTSGIQ